MQGGRSILDSLADTIDLNQGSVSGSTSNAMDHSSVWGDLLNPVENRSSNYMLSSGDTNAGCETTSSHSAGHQEQDMFSFPLTDAALGRSRNQPPRSFASSESSPYHPSQSQGYSHSPRKLIPTLRSGATGWVADQNLTGQNQQGLIEYAPWTPFPPVELDYGNQRAHFHESLSSVEADMLSSSNRRRQHRNSMSALMMDSPSDAISSWRALAVDVEGRQRLIRQVRNAVRRRDNWRAQDFAIFGQFVNGAAELRDRHSGMRLDVDSMSYEDLLALEERIGNVSIGLNEETIMKSMKQRKYQPTQSSSNDEACCICWEEYVTGDDIGTVACSHEFHTDCIKQ